MSGKEVSKKPAKVSGVPASLAIISSIIKSPSRHSAHESGRPEVNPVVSLLPVHFKQCLNMGDLDSLASNNYSLARTLLDDLPHTGIDSSRDL